jgi:hypothetical protein
VSLDASKLDGVRELGNGVVQARCPACAEGGHDKSGEHLRIYPDGRYGCCVYPKDPEHRKRIHALAGERSQQSIKVRVTAVKIAAPIHSGIFQKISGLFPPTAPGTAGTGDSDSEKIGTPGTGVNESNATTAGELFPDDNNFGTLGTPSSLLTRVCARENNSHIYKLKELVAPRPKRPRCLHTATEEGEDKPLNEELPFLTADGSLSIPFNSPERYHWWKGGQSVAETLKEVIERSASARPPEQRRNDEYEY